MAPSSTDVARRRRLWAFPAEPWMLGGLAIVLTALAVLFPVSGDDWAWGTSVGTDRLHDRFAGYNGRWLGNLAVLVLTRAAPLTPLVVAATVCLLLMLLVWLADLRTPAGYLGAAALVLAMPLGVWRQTIVWVSGFSNYTLSTVCLLIFLVCVRRDWGRPSWRAPRVVALLALPFAVASALFMEHVTILLVLASVANLALLLRRRRSAWVAGAWGLGSLLGAAIMFSNSAYDAVAGGSSTYQGVTDTGVGAILRQGTGGVSQYAITVNTVLNVALAMVVAALALAVRARTGRLTPWQWAAVGSGGVAVAGSAAVRSSVDAQNYFGDLTAWSWIPALGLLLAIVLSAVHLVEDPDRARAVLLLVAATALLIAPMAALHPYGPRNFLPTYVLITLIVLILVRELADRLPGQVLPTGVGIVGAGVCLAVLGGYLAVYADIHDAQADRIAQIRQAVEQGRRRVAVPELPHAGYVHNPDPASDGDMSRFKRYYHLPARLHITFVPR